MVTTSQAPVPAPTKVSNRTVIQKMVEWGWVPGRVSGDNAEMRWNGKKVIVRPAHSHTGNSATIIETILTTMDATWAELMAGPQDAPEPAPVPDPPLVHRNSKGHYEKLPESILERPAVPAVEFRLDETTCDEPVVPEPAPAKVKEKKHKFPEVIPRLHGTRSADLVYTALRDADGPLSTGDLGELAGIPQRSVGTFCSMMVRGGYLTRISPAVYEVNPAKEVVDEALLRPAAIPQEPLSVGATIARQVWAATHPVPAIPEKPSVNVDDTVNEVLDLLFPEGFKAKHLPAIDRWRTATIELINEVQGEVK